MISWLLGFIPGLMPLVNSVIGYLDKRADASVAKNAQAANVNDAAISYETSRVNAMKDLTLSVMSHPIWWAAWGIGVFPVLVYHGAIFFVSTFPAMGWTIKKVPAEEIEFGRTVVGYMFGIGGTSSLVTGIVHAWKSRV